MILKNKYALAIGLAIGSLALLIFVLGRFNGGSATAQDSQTTDFETLLAQQLGVSLDTLHKVETAALAVAADKASAASIISADQASTLRNFNASPLLNRLFDEIATTAGTSDANLYNSLRNGASLAQIAAANNIGRDDLKSRLTNVAQTELAQAQKAGLLDQQQAGGLSLLLSGKLDKLIDALPAHSTR